MMSTVKTDAITAVSTNGDLSLDGIGTGGVSIASTLKMTKGGDISSASPLVIDTDGNYFDVTGTTNFAAMTVEEGNFFMLQFDGALTITHGSGIELPGAANLTTAAGDRLICYATAADTVEVMSVETEAAPSASVFTKINKATASSSANLTVTGLSDTYKTYVIEMSDIVHATDNQRAYFQLGDSSGIDSGASDYGWYFSSQEVASTGTTLIYEEDHQDSQIRFQNTSAGHLGNATDEAMAAWIILHRSDGSTFPMMHGDVVFRRSSGDFQWQHFIADRHADIELDRILYAADSGNITSGTMTVWGVSNA